MSVPGVHLVRRLGTWLVERGLCQQALVDQALQFKVVFGGRLGTNLVELGYLTPEALESELAAMHDVPVAPGGWLDAPEAAAREALPHELVEKLRCLPLRIQDGTFHVAMLDSSDAEQQRALAAATGLAVQTYAIAELRLGVLLEHHYGIRRDVRYARLDGPGSGAASAPLDREGGELIDEETFASLHSAWEQRGYGDGTEVGAIELTELAESEVEPGDPAAFEARILAAADRDSVAAEALRLARRFAPAAALLVVRGGVVAGFRGDGMAVPERIDGIMLPADADSAIARVAVSGRPFRGPVREAGLDRMVLRALGRADAREILVLPISLRGRVVNLLYADAAPLAETSRAALAALCDVIAHAYGSLILSYKRRLAAAREESAGSAA
jgi:hypothetical protein